MPFEPVMGKLIFSVGAPFCSLHAPLSPPHYLRRSVGTLPIRGGTGCPVLSHLPKGSAPCMCPTIFITVPRYPRGPAGYIQEWGVHYAGYTYTNYYRYTPIYLQHGIRNTSVGTTVVCTDSHGGNWVHLFHVLDVRR